MPITTENRFWENERSPIPSISEDELKEITSKKIVLKLKGLQRFT